MAARATKDVIRSAFEALNRRDQDQFAGLHADDVVLHGPEGDLRGAEALTAHEFEIFDVFSDLAHELRSLVAEEDLVAARWRSTGTHDGDLGEVGPTGEEVAIDVFGMFRVADDRVAEVWVLPDRLRMMQQIGTWMDPAAR